MITWRTLRNNQICFNFQIFRFCLTEIGRSTTHFWWIQSPGTVSGVCKWCFRRWAGEDNMATNHGWIWRATSQWGKRGQRKGKEGKLKERKGRNGLEKNTPEINIWSYSWPLPGIGLPRYRLSTIVIGLSLWPACRFGNLEFAAWQVNMLAAIALDIPRRRFCSQSANYLSHSYRLVSVCGHSHGRLSWSIFKKIVTDVRTPKSKNEFVWVNIASPLLLFCPPHKNLF